MTYVLFIGGCADGKREWMPNQLRDYYHVPEVKLMPVRKTVPEMAELDIHHYRLEIITDKRETYCTYVYEKIKNSELIPILLAAYKRNDSKDGERHA